MQNEMCELRFDVPLPHDGGPRQFEHVWRQVLAAQRLTALATPPAQAVSARFRLCGTSRDNSEHASALARYLPTRLAALPGAPTVVADPPAASPDWQGVKVWLSYRAPDLAALLQKSRKPSKKTHHARGHRR